MTTSSSSDGAPLRVGATRYMPSGIIRFDQYRSGETAIEIIDQHGEPQYVATVALVPYGAPHPGEYGVWLKGWSENEGVPEALVNAGIITLTGRKHPTGFCEAQHAELTEHARAALMRARGAVGAANCTRSKRVHCKQRELLGDSVYVENDGGMIRLTGNAFSRENVIFLESEVYAALRRWAHAHGYERVPQAGEGDLRDATATTVVHIHAELTDQEAWNLAQFIKRLRFDQCCELTDSGHAQQDRREQAYVMLAAINKIGNALKSAGYAPR